MDDREVHELSAAYALDALDQEERLLFEEQLAVCARCREDVVGFEQTAGALAYGAPAAEPSRGLRERILDDVQERETVVPLRRPRLAFRAALGLAAAAAAAAIGLGIWAASLSGELDRTREALEIVADPEAQSVGLDGAVGRLVVAPDGRAALVVHGLDPAPPGKAYEVWVILGDRPRAAGLFAGGEERELVRLDRPVPENAVVAVTLEDEGGVDAPTGTPLFTAPRRS